MSGGLAGGEADRLHAQMVRKFSEGSYGRRAGTYEHDARVIRQLRAAAVQS